MNITRHNYEEFFILYLDNELPAADRQLVEAFAAAHPDLKLELEMLQMSKLVPDTDLVFENKKQLLKSSGISLGNYEEALLLYTDNELSETQKRAVEKFAANHSSVQQELNNLQKTILEPDTAIVFPDKESLYRKEERVRIVYFSWKRIAVAAAILFAIGSTVFFIANKKEDAGPLAEEKKAIQQPAVTGPETAEKTSTITGTSDPVLADNNTKSGDTPDETPVNKRTTVPENKINIYQRAQPSLHRAIANNIEEKKDNQLPQPTYNPNALDIAKTTNITRPENITGDALTISTEIKQTPAVTPGVARPLDNIIAAASIEPTEDVFAATEPGRKNKLRGFFRKVTRTFEKTTNIKATDDEDRLLIGGLAIRL